MRRTSRHLRRNPINEDLLGEAERNLFSAKTYIEDAKESSPPRPSPREGMGRAELLSGAAHYFGRASAYRDDAHIPPDHPIRAEFSFVADQLRDLERTLDRAIKSGNVRRFSRRRRTSRRR